MGANRRQISLSVAKVASHSYCGCKWKCNTYKYMRFIQISFSYVVVCYGFGTIHISQLYILYGHSYLCKRWRVSSVVHLSFPSNKTGPVIVTPYTIALNEFHFQLAPTRGTQQTICNIFLYLRNKVPNEIIIPLPVHMFFFYFYYSNGHVTFVNVRGIWK